MTYQEALRRQLQSKTAKRRGPYSAAYEKYLSGTSTPSAVSASKMQVGTTAEANPDMLKRGSGNIRAIIEAVKRHCRNSGIGKTAASGYGRLYDKCPTT